MNNTIRLYIKYILYGISWGCTCFVLSCLACFCYGGVNCLFPIMKDFSYHAIGAMIVGIACGSTSVIYQFDRLSNVAKTLIHFSVGMGVFFPTALYLGWIPFYPNQIIYTVLQFLLSCGIFTAIWFCFYLFNRSEAKRINNRLKELEQDNTDQKE